MEHFFALDVETANVEASSLCQIGIVEFLGGKPVNTWQSLINPKTYFDGFNISIHGITPEMVKDSPAYPQVFEKIQSLVNGQIVVTHMPFDQNALRQASALYNLPEITCTWLDSARVARRQWEEFRQSGYGLSNLADFLGIQYAAHDAAEDARAAGLVVIAAMLESGLTLKDWQELAYRRIVRASQNLALAGNPDGLFYGETLVFTGKLSLRREEAAHLAAQAGCNVTDGVTKETTILVVGLQDQDKLAGYEKSSKHRKAEDLAAKGQLIKIVSEKDFQTLIASAKKSKPAKKDRLPKAKKRLPQKNDQPDQPKIAKLQRPIDTPIRDFIDMDHRWRGPDQGLIWCWERGRQMAIENPALASRAKTGELMILGWRGGVTPGYKAKKKQGTLNYLAQWQGLSGLDLDIDPEQPVTLTCSLTEVLVTYSADGWKTELQETE